MGRFLTVKQGDKYQVGDDTLEVLEVGHPSMSFISSKSVRVSVRIRVSDGTTSKDIEGEFVALLDYLNNEGAARLEVVTDAMCEGVL